MMDSWILDQPVRPAKPTSASASTLAPPKPLRGERSASKDQGRDRRASHPRVRVQPPPDVEVIVLSSDDDEPPARTHKRPRRSGSGSSANVNANANSNSSLEMALGSPTAREDAGTGGTGAEAESSVTAVALLRRENEALKRELDRYRAACDKAETRAHELDNALKRKSASSNPDLADLEEGVSCEICTLTMWKPATLPACGHTFCEKCLHGWFSTTHAAHVRAHPNPNANPGQGLGLGLGHALLAGAELELGRGLGLGLGLGPIIPEQYLRHLDDPRVAEAVRTMQTEYARRLRFGLGGVHAHAHAHAHVPVPVPLPVYTCPTCRVPVRVRPVEVYALKSLVRGVKKVTGGEGSPVSAPRTVVRAGGANANANVGVGGSGSVWDGFFPPTRS